MTLTLILLAGVGGEALAIYALSQQQASASTQHHVLSSAIILTFATAAGPIISNATAYAGAHRAPAPAIPGPPPVPASRHARALRTAPRPMPKRAARNGQNGGL
jgi:hypothetical protein